MKNRQEIREEVMNILSDSGLSVDDRGLWLDCLAGADPNAQVAFIDAFDGELELLRFFTADLRQRIMAGDDREALGQILSEEKKYFVGIPDKQTEE
jgi:hypothetical protein